MKNIFRSIFGLLTLIVYIMVPVLALLKTMSGEYVAAILMLSWLMVLMNWTILGGCIANTKAIRELASVCQNLVALGALSEQLFSECVCTKPKARKTEAPKATKAKQAQQEVTPKKRGRKPKAK